MADISPQDSFETLKSNVLKTITSYFPYEGRQRKLEVEKIWVDDKLNIDDIHSQAEAKHYDRTWGVPVKAQVKLTDKNTGKVIETKTITMARLPKMTSRYGFIVDGNEYQVDHLFRLKSGVYARVQDNGDLESEFNLVKGPAGNRFSVLLDRESKRFYLKQGDAHIPLYPILHAMGATDDQLKSEWGSAIFDANKPKTLEKYTKHLQTFFKKTSDDEAEPKDVEGYSKYLRHYFDQTVLRPDTTKVTLGKPFEKVDSEVLRLASSKILGVARQTHEPDDRDSLAFKEIASAEDFIPEKIERAAKSIRGRLRQTVDHKESISEIVSPDLFGKPVREFFTKGGSLAERSDQTNPVQMLAAHRKTTLMSADLGGIKREHSLTDDMRVINPSHFGFLDVMKTPESERTGITVNLSLQAKKLGKELALPVYNMKSGKMEYVKAPEFHSATAVLADQVRWEKGKPRPIGPVVKVKVPGGGIELRKFDEAMYVMPTTKGMWDVTSNLIPFLPSDQGNRVSMADKQMEQAISLKDREAPLVQTKTENPRDPDHTFDKAFGSFSSIRSPVHGRVSEVHKDHIIVMEGHKKHKIPIYDHFPLNDVKGMMNSEPVVKVGDTVKSGQLLADTNYTKNGTLALGTNLRVGYMPYKGYNFEDGIVISETAAKKLTSDHLYKKKLELDPEADTISRSKFEAYLGLKSTILTKEQKQHLDDDGVVKAGSKLVPGSVMVAAVGKNNADNVLSGYGKRNFSPYRDKSLYWDEDHVGTVVKVIKDPTGKGVKVYVKTEEPMQVGDKLSGRHGNKGIVTMILPDHEMPFTHDPKTKERTPLEVMLNPSGVPTRMNLGQVFETAASKIAEKTGKAYVVNNFGGPNTDYRSQVEAELKKHGIPDEENVFDPKDPNKALGSVLVGKQYLLKLKHQVEKKLNVRGGGTDTQGKGFSYTADRQPTRGGDKGGQGFGALEIYSLLGHNARHTLREMATYKSDQQDMDFWSRIQNGFDPPAPKPSFAYNKFVGLLQGMGVNVVRQGTQLQLLPMTDKDVLKMSKGEIKNAHLTIRAKDLKEEKAGLFDKDVTGGLTGTNWSHIRLAEPMPNPIFVGSNNRPGPVPTLLGLKLKDFELVMAGKGTIDGKTGGHAIKAALEKIDVEKELKDLKARMPNLQGGDLDRANKKIKFLAALSDSGLKPSEAYILSHLPVLPPVFRQVSVTPRGDLHLADVNGLYKNFAILNNKMHEFDPKVFGETHRAPIRADLWESFKALQSVGGAVGFDTDSPGAKRKLKGILDLIGSGEGEQPKEGFFQSKLVKRQQDLSIRSTITPEPSLKLDQVGIPRNAAMELYKPFVVAKMVTMGFDPLSAQQEIKKGTQNSFTALQSVLKDRPLILKRDPALHKFSVMAFEPVLVEGKSIRIHPLVTGGFNADFDGDTMAGTVPVSRDAVEEAKKLFPSKNLFSPTTGGVMYTPSQEAMLGLHLISKWGPKANKTYKTVADLDAAKQKGEIGPNDVVTVKQLGAKPTTWGRTMLNAHLPKNFSLSQSVLHDPEFSVTKKTMGQITSNVAKNHEPEFDKVINQLKDLGNEHSYRSGFSFGLKDLKPLEARGKILDTAKKEVEEVFKTIHDKEKRNDAVIKIYEEATKSIDDAARLHHKQTGGDNRLMTMVFSGARGKPEQLRQMIAAPMLMQDAKNRTIPLPVTRSYAEGLDIGDYWLAQHGARKGTLQRALGTSEPGVISKDIINTTMNSLVVSSDCKTTKGVSMSVTAPDIHDRFLAQGYELRDGSKVKPGTLLTPEILSKLRNSKIEEVQVRSPLKCQHGHDGICAKCYGLNENGHLHDTGTNIGVLAGQAMGEPAVQMAMDAFHSGGLATGRGAKSVDRFTRLRQLLSMPKKLPDAATLSKGTGKITAIKKDAVGGIDVFVDGEKHFVPSNLVAEEVEHGGEKYKISVGQTVKKGMPLSLGPINPRHLLPLSDIHKVQNYLTNELYEGLYEKEGVRRRNIEVVVRALTNLTKVKDPGQSDWTHGDVISRAAVEEHNRTIKKGQKPVLHEPMLRGIEQVPLSQPDWMARLNYRELHNTLMSGASQSWKTDLHGSHPVPALAYGAELGKPPTDTKAKKPYSY